MQYIQIIAESIVYSDFLTHIVWEQGILKTAGTSGLAARF
jgi:hypothetical protein